MKPSDSKQDYLLMEVTQEQITCKHYNFAAEVDIHRLTENEAPDAKVTGFIADISIRCSECGLPFRFVGLPSGVSTQEPMVNIEATEASLPIIPAGKAYVVKTSLAN